MIPHERSLVDKWKDRPFALIGVNSDNTSTEKGMELYKTKAKEMGVTWRSFRNDYVPILVPEVEIVLRQYVHQLFRRPL